MFARGLVVRDIQAIYKIPSALNFTTFAELTYVIRGALENCWKIVLTSQSRSSAAVFFGGAQHKCENFW